MSVAEMQAALARLCADEPFREWFGLAPDAALAKYALDEGEQAALRSVNAKMLGLFAETMLEDRRRRVLRYYPLCEAVHPEPVRRYFDRYCGLRSVRPGATTVESALDFGRYLTECLSAEYAAGPMDGGYAADLCRYEMIFAELGSTPLPSEDPLAPPAPGSVSVAPENPALAPGVRYARFGYDIPALAGEIEQDHVPDSVAPQETFLVVRSVHQSGTTEAFRVGEAVVELLSLCTGTAALADIRKGMASLSGDDDSVLDDALGRLAAAGLILYRPAAGSGG